MGLRVEGVRRLSEGSWNQGGKVVGSRECYPMLSPGAEFPRYLRCRAQAHGVKAGYVRGRVVGT